MQLLGQERGCWEEGSVAATVPAALSIRTLGGPTLFRTVGNLRLLA